MPVQQIRLPRLLVFPIRRLRNDICFFYGYIRDFFTLLGLNAKVIFAELYVLFPPINRFPNTHRIRDGINLFAKAINKIMRQNGIPGLSRSVIRHGDLSPGTIRKCFRGKRASRRTIHPIFPKLCDTGINQFYAFYGKSNHGAESNITDKNHIQRFRNTIGSV